MRHIFVIHGPNLNLLGEREPELYGTETLEEINQYISDRAREYDLRVSFFQSNHEGAIIDKLHEVRGEVDGVVINPAAYTHYSYAIRDAIAAIKVPTVEVHLSDISRREAFRRVSVLADVCVYQIMGYGRDSYVYAIETLLGLEVAEKFSRQAASLADRDAMLKEAVRLLHTRFPKYDWTGIYLLEGQELVLHNFIGAPSPHTRIPVGKGICGAAVAEEKTIIVPDVHADPRYLACSLETQSEIVVPIVAGGKIVGEIDIDSHRPDAFKEHDQWYLEKMAEAIGARAFG